MILVALTLGIFGSLHCIGMCGPFALGISRLSMQNNFTIIINALNYNFGRIVTYVIIGLVFGMISESIAMAGFQKLISIGLGVFLVVLFIISVDLEHVLKKHKLSSRLLKILSQKIVSISNSPLFKKPFFIGLINGLLPCGLVYLAVAGSLTAGNIYQGGLFMLIFLGWALFRHYFY